MITHIMNKNYDTNDFANFMSTKKAGGNDINNFTFDEVLEVSSRGPSCRLIKLTELRTSNN